MGRLTFDELHAKLLGIPHTRFPYDFLPYIPAAVKLRDESTIPRVVFFGKSAYAKIWGMVPRPMIDLDWVIDVGESENQLSPKFAELLYTTGEDGMGFRRFSLTMDDGTRFLYTVGGICDLIKYPKGYNRTRVSSLERGIDARLLPEVKKEIIEQPSYAWCLYNEPPEIAERIETQGPKLG
jgi:hypothetical protein